MKKLILTLIAALGIVTGAHAAEGGDQGEDDFFHGCGLRLNAPPG